MGYTINTRINHLTLHSQPKHFSLRNSFHISPSDNLSRPPLMQWPTKTFVRCQYSCLPGSHCAYKSLWYHQSNCLCTPLFWEKFVMGLLKLLIQAVLQTTAHPGRSPDNSSSWPFSRQQLIQAVLQTTAHPGRSPDNSSSRPFSRQQLIQAVLQTTAPPGCSPDNSSSRPFSRQQLIQTTAHPGCSPDNSSSGRSPDNSIQAVLQTTAPPGCSPDNSSSRLFSRQLLIQAVLQTTHPGCSPNNCRSRLLSRNHCCRGHHPVSAIWLLCWQ